MDYQITSISKEDYCNSINTLFTVYISLFGGKDKIELRLNGLKDEKEVEDFVKSWDKPLRLKNTFPFTNFRMDTIGEHELYSTECEWHGVHITARSINEDALKSFIDYLNNPEIPSMDVLIKKHIHLSGLIEGYINSILELKKEQRLIEYRMWTYSNVKNNDED